MGLDSQAPSPQAHPRAVKQSADEETAKDLGASAAEDGHTPVVVEGPVVEVPLTREEPAAEHPITGCSWPLDSQEEDQVEVHAPKEDPDD